MMLARRRERKGPAGDDASAVELARNLIGETREEIGRADHKAATLLAGVLVAAGLVAGRSQPPALRLAPASALWWIAALATGVGVALLCACVYPAGTRRQDRLARHVGYFGHLNECSTVEQIAAALRRQVAAPELEWLSRTLLTLSAIASRKHRLVRLAIWTFAAAVALAIASVLAGRVP
jgi:Family of unknown function (DUF5706)